MQFLRAAVFFPMLWLRGLVIVLGRTISGLCTISGFIVGGISALTRYHYWAIAGGLLFTGFLVFLLLQFYDSLLVRLNPTNRSFLFYQ